MMVVSCNTDNGAVVAWCVDGVQKWQLLGKWCSGDRGGPGGIGGVSCVTVVATNCCNGSNGIKWERERERERERAEIDSYFLKTKNIFHLFWVIF